jgi:hypothetical protein
MKKIRILIANAPEEVGGVTCWRMFWPMRHLEARYHDTVEIRYSRGTIFPFEMYQTDILICYRPSEPAHLQVMEEAKRIGCRILVDYDDDYLSIATGHPAFWKLGNRAPLIRRALELADAVWTSTEELKAVYKHANTTVVPNAVLPEEISSHPADFRKKVFVWAGSDAHREDVDVFIDTYRTLLNRADRFLWINFMPSWVASVSKSKNTDVDLSPWVHTEAYFEFLRKNQVSAIWKPLQTNQFNRGKSNIAWITATVVGAICISNQAGQPGWEYAVKEFPKTFELFEEIWKDSRQVILDKYNLNHWNEVRHTSILKLANDEHSTP